MTFSHKAKNFFNDIKKNPQYTTNDLDQNLFNDDLCLDTNLSINLSKLKEVFCNIDDIIFRSFRLYNKINAYLIYLDNFTDKKMISDELLKPLLYLNNGNSYDIASNFNDFYKSLSNSLVIPNINRSCKFNLIITNILSGNVCLLVDNFNEAIILDLRKSPKRSISESIIEPVIRGPRDGFTEELSTNLILIRKRLKTTKLKVIRMNIGTLSHTDLVITYLDGIANKTLVEAIKNKLSAITIDAVLESGYIEELLQSSKLSVFSELGYTERPDRLVSSLLEGHVGIIIDNTPIALIAPQTFFQGMQSSEDYYQSYIASFLLRFIRYIFLINALVLPSFYIAVLCFHQGMIPRNLLFTIINSRKGVPFPVLVEALFMEIFFEGLREAGIRLPSPAGQTVSIVGALVIGEAAVKAGIVSSSMVIIVSITGISSFIIPRYSLALSIRVIRFGIMILSGTFGLYGLYLGVLVLLIHLAKIDSFGVPYLSPLAPLDLSSLRDIIFRAPWWKLRKRPSFIQKNNIYRRK